MGCPLVPCARFTRRWLTVLPCAQAAGRVVVMSGDTAYLPALADFARGADLLVHEAMLGAALPALVARVGNGDDRLMRHLLQSHTTASDAAKIARDADVGA